ncbi:MAG: hypothetical protein RL389_867, partial [Actinomycetota bacterium]
MLFRNTAADDEQIWGKQRFK